jgi:hypothetical protein
MRLTTAARHASGNVLVDAAVCAAAQLARAGAVEAKAANRPAKTDIVARA